MSFIKNTDEKNQSSEPTTVHVSVAVVHYQNQFLLGYRNAQQHQGEKYEFVGGKIENGETGLQALIREVKEEIGVLIESDSCQKMGQINHHYVDKNVCLHVFKVTFNQQQFVQMKNKKMGELGQTILWVSKKELLENKYCLPDANADILQWLKDESESR